MELELEELELEDVELEDVELEEELELDLLELLLEELDEVDELDEEDLLELLDELVLEVEELELLELLELEAATLMANAGNEVVALPSLTEMAMLPYVPTAVAAGVPLNLPVDVLNLAQLGLLATLKVSVSPLASAAVGIKL
ncbi:MAG: hypothetical protein QM808_00930 [Steroidobacteraceae bacterium]